MHLEHTAMETQPNPPYDLSAEHHPNVVANYGRSPVRCRGEGVWLMTSKVVFS